MWSEEEIQFLFDNPKMSIIDIARKLGKTESAVKSKRSRLKITTETCRQWTSDEKRILQYNYDKGKDELMKLLPGRTWDAIRSRARFLRKGKWNL